MIPWVFLFSQIIVYSIETCSTFLVKDMLDRSVTPLPWVLFFFQILVYSFETGQEVVLRGGTRLSAYVPSSDQGTAGAGAGVALSLIHI